MTLRITVEDIAKRMMDLLSGCLREAINTALTEKYGYSWVEIYRKDFNADVESKNIERREQGKKDIVGLRDNIVSIGNFDFQACLKLILYMYEGYGSTVLEKYDLLPSKDTILSLINELIIFRNKFSHKDNRENDDVDTYVCEQAILHMKTLVSYFPGIVDKQTGKTYKSEIEEIYFDFNKRQNTKPYRFSDFNEFRSVTDDKLTQACAKLSIKTEYDINRNLVFYSYDVRDDIKRIRISLENDNANAYSEVFVPPQGSAFYNGANGKKKRKKVLPAVIVAVVIILLVVIAALLNRDDSQSETGQTANETTASTTSDQQSVYDTASQIIGEAMEEYSKYTQETTSSAAQTTNESSSRTNEIPEEYRAIFEARDSSWSEDLAVGETHISSFVSNINNIWSNVRGYSEDTSIATVGDDLIVTAQSPGVVRVLYVGEFSGHDETYIIEYTIR